jgi:hypothetical protein
MLGSFLLFAASLLMAYLCRKGLRQQPHSDLTSESSSTAVNGNVFDEIINFVHCACEAERS